MSKRLLLSSGIIIVSLAFNATAFASDGAYKLRNFQAKAPAVMGTVSSVNGSSITLNTKKGTAYTIDTSNAKITKSDSQIKVSDISDGDTLIVVGSVTDNNIDATKIIDGVVKNKDFKVNYFTGKITSLSGVTLTIQSIEKKQTLTEVIKIDGNTIITKDGQPSSLPNLSVGQTVIVTGTKDGNVITAASVSIGFNKVGTRIIGTVESIFTDTMSVKDNKGTLYTVNITKAKIIDGKNSIQVGEKVAVFGSQISGTTNVTATVVRKHNS